MSQPPPPSKQLDRKPSQPPPSLPLEEGEENLDTHTQPEDEKDPAASKEKDKTGKTKESTDSDFDKIIGQRMEVPLCNYGPDCR